MRTATASSVPFWSATEDQLLTRSLLLSQLGENPLLIGEDSLLIAFEPCLVTQNPLLVRLGRGVLWHQCLPRAAILRVMSSLPQIKPTRRNGATNNSVRIGRGRRSYVASAWL